MSDEPTFDPRRKAAIRELVVSNAEAHPGRANGRKRTALVAGLVVLALSISGGTVAYAFGTGLIDLPPGTAPTATTTPPPTATPTPTPTPTPTATPTPIPTHTEPAEDPADPSTWIIGFDGVGPFRLGQTFGSQAHEAPGFVDRTDAICTDSYLWLRSTASSIGLVGATDGSQRTAAIEVGSSGWPDRATSPATAEGIGVGSTYEELQAAYPGIQQTGSYADISYYFGLTDGKGGWIVFNVVRNSSDERLNDKVAAIQIANEAVMPVENGSVRTMPSERCPA
ncbi:hypothetical protein [Leifsonia sp. AG29]|uniref:hypothetical protein n=1 Tax=Leifsonia sp. AG29 TaxID=2598860 RepID=UPI0018EEED20|nr:hypothetical protein [Leifsonia sp. AG29]